MQHCENCGSELSTKALFCRQCGQRIGSETELATNMSDAPIEDVSLSSIPTSAAFSEFEDPASEKDVEEVEQMSQLAPETDVEKEEPIPQPASEKEMEEEEPIPQSAPENDSEEGKPIPQLASEKVEALSPLVSAQRMKPRSRSIPKLLLFLLAILIVAAGVAAALIGLFQGNLPGTAGAANTLSSSSDSVLINTAGPSLNASICTSSSTPSTPGTSSGISLIPTTTSGCSSFNSAIATSMCLIFPYNSDAFHRYILDVSNVTVESKAYHMVLSLAQYAGATTYSDTVHITVGIGEGSTGRDFSWMYHSGKVTVNSDEQSGTMDVILASASGGNTIHVVGGWTCGRLIKSL